MNETLNAQFEQLKDCFDCVECKTNETLHWFKVQYLSLTGWSPSKVPAVFYITVTYPDTAPYGFFVPKELKLNGNPPFGVKENKCLYEGDWHFISHAVDEEWQSAVSSGFNLLTWVRSFPERINSTE